MYVSFLLNHPSLPLLELMGAPFILTRELCRTPVKQLVSTILSCSKSDDEISKKSAQTKENHKDYIVSCEAALENST